jgi:exonuclease III
MAQKVTSTEVLNLPDYTTHHNVGASMRGTAIMAKNRYLFDRIVTSPSGRAIAVVCYGVLVVNVYAPSGTAMRSERELYFNTELPFLFRSDHHHILCGGNFNCVLQPIDVLGHFSRSPALAELVRRFHVRDTWTQDPARPTFTFYHASSASRLDRIYLTPDLSAHKSGIQILPAAFTDHCAVALRIRFPESGIIRSPRLWKIDPCLKRDPIFQHKLQADWATWRKNTRYYVDVAQWWERCVTKRLKRLVRREMAERNAE